jgi:eukaryotic-like serine/threonine-protein kinase
MVVAVALGAVSGSLLGVLTAPASKGDAGPALAPPAAVAPSTTRRPRVHSAGVTSTSVRPRRYRPPASTAASRPTSTTRRPATTTTTLPPTTTTTQPPTTTTAGTTTTAPASTTTGPPTTT